MEQPVDARGRKAWRVARFGLELLVIVLVVLAVERFMTRDALRGQLPPVTVTLLDGTALDLRQERPAMIYFWATWCPVCRMEQGTIDSLASDYPVVTVAMQSGNAHEVANHLAQEGLAWRTVADSDGSLSHRFGVVGVPALFVLDRDGNIDYVARGYTTGIGLRLRLWLARWG